MGQAAVAKGDGGFARVGDQAAGPVETAGAREPTEASEALADAAKGVDRAGDVVV